MTIDEKLLGDVDQVIADLGTTRSAFIREALKRRRMEQLEERHREAYARTPQRPDEFEFDLLD